MRRDKEVRNQGKKRELGSAEPYDVLDMINSSPRSVEMKRRVQTWAGRHVIVGVLASGLGRRSNPVIIPLQTAQTPPPSW